MRHALTLCAILVAATALVATGAGAASWASGSGSLATSGSKVTTDTVGKAKIYTIRQAVKWTGPINGTAREVLWEVVTPSGAPFSGVDVCACVAANGGKGTVTIRFQGTDNGKIYSGTFTAGSGTGALAGFQGHGTFKGSDKTGQGTYTGVFT